MAPGVGTSHTMSLVKRGMHTKGELGGEHHGGVLTHFWAGAVFENDSLSIPMVWFDLDFERPSTDWLAVFEVTWMVE